MAMKPGQHISVVIITLLITELHGELNNKTNYARCDDGVDVFNCSGAGFVEIPPPIHIPFYMKTLDLSNNLIQKLSFINHTTLGENLEVLILRNNQIAHMQSDGFIHFTNLVYLDLSGNNIQGKKIEERMFNDLESLTTLNMEKNPMVIIKENTFHFMELPRLEHLDISHCLIKTVQPSGLDLPKLMYLDLSWNLLETLDRQAFHMLVELITLDLSHNKFKVLAEVPYFPEIRTINLDSNLIEVVNISDSVFKTANTLERLYMRNNDIIRFTRESFPLTLETLVELRLENNKINCDCRMTWFKGEHYDFTDRNISIPCQYPVQLRGRNLLDVDINDLRCGYPLWEVLLLVGIIVVGMIVCVMSAYLICKKKCKCRRLKLTRKPSNSSDRGGNYTAVFTKDEDDVRVAINDDRALLQGGREFDV